MPTLSHKIQQMPASPIRKLMPYADAAKTRGTHVFHLNIGQPDLETPPQYFDAIRDADLKVVAYSHSAGYLSFRKAIISYYSNLGFDLGSDQVLVTTGASEALGFIFTTCMNPDDEVIIPEPFYANYNGFANAAGVTVKPIPTDIESDFALPEIEQFEALITSKTKGILICNPGNPTGIVYPESALQKLREIVLKHDLFLIVDEVYREFVYDGATHVSALSLEGLEDHVIVTDSISKRFSACGARIGCIVSRNTGVMEGTLKLAQARLSPPSLGQIGAERLYALPSAYYDEVKSEYERRKVFLYEALNRIPGVLCPAVNGAFYAMVRLPVDDSEKFCQWMLESFSFEGNTVMMAPGAGFYATPGLGKNEVRIAYVLNEADLAAAVRCLAMGLETYPGRIIAPETLESAS
ncbi:MAG: pyridoxal phosphate-dependent aminotransferase [Bacteroidota bacterium]